MILSAGDLRIWGESCIRSGSNEQKDHVAEATLMGTTIARFTVRKEPPRTLTVMPLDPVRRRRSMRRTATDMR